MRNYINKHKMPVFIVLNLLLTIGMNLAHPVTPSLMKGLNLAPHVFGVSFAAMCTTNFIFALIWSNVANGMKKSKILAISSIGYALAQIIFGLAHTEGTIYIARLLSGIFAGGFQVGFMSFIVNEADESEQSKYITMSSVIVSVGSALGFFFGGFLGDIDVRMTFMIQAVLHIVLGVAVYVLLAPTEVIDEHIEWGMIKASNPFKIIGDSRYLIRGFMATLLIVTFTTSIGSTLFDQSFNYYIKDIFNFAPSQNGIIKFITGLFAVILNIILIRRSRGKQIFNKSFLKTLFIAMGILAIIVGFIPSVSGFVSVSLIWFAAYTVMIPALQNSVLSLKSSPEEGNKLAGLYNSLMMFGKIFGALLTSAVYTINPVSSFIVSGTLFVLSFTILVFSKHD
ncbi:MFS transporter [Erysipelothrix sp. HDW6C]|uniref:MFS transporter n=1 Tax=Erysipelothrix sp. HDW6C TaxID=2714930 RepID=UPI00140C378F|nr:MFS transporter [Erysipelothrix sp. HDW6C]QIK70824.1 MFS transporter [Erysipelothrix sp. HDW6C]